MTVNWRCGQSRFCLPHLNCCRADIPLYVTWRLGRLWHDGDDVAACLCGCYGGMLHRPVWCWSPSREAQESQFRRLIEPHLVKVYQDFTTLHRIYPLVLTRCLKRATTRRKSGQTEPKSRSNTVNLEQLDQTVHYRGRTVHLRTQRRFHYSLLWQRWKDLNNQIACQTLAQFNLIQHARPRRPSLPPLTPIW
jgi:hypothetical protein